MSVSMLSSVRGAIKNMALELKWKERKQNPSMQKTSLLDDIERVNKQNEQHRKAMIRQGMEGKLKAGRRLSSADMEYLRQHEPDLYDKAVRIEKEREEYRRELERCKSKDEVRELNSRKMSLLSGEARSANQGGMSSGEKTSSIEFIGMRAAAIMDEHSKFLDSSEYKKLPKKTFRHKKTRMI